MRASRISAAMSAAALFLAVQASGYAATVTWTDSDGVWDNATNWSSNPLLPGSGDDVVINISGGATITHQLGDDTVQTLTLGSTNPNNNLAVTGGTLTVTGVYSNTTGHTNISGGSLILNGASTLKTYTQSGGSLEGTGTVTITGAGSFAGGQMLGTGTTIVQGAATFGGSSLGLDDGRTLELRGGGTLNSNTIYLNPNSTGNPTAGVLRNAVGSTLVDTGDSFLYAQNFGTADDGASALFDNRGTFRKNGSTGTTSIYVNFTNSGTLDVQTGTLTLGYNSTIGGTVTVASGATLMFSDATGSVVHNINNASAVSSSGTIQITSGTVNVTGALSNGGQLLLQGGTLNAGGAVATASYTQSSGILSGSANLTVTGAASLTGGQMLGTGTTIVQGAATFGGSILGLDDGRTLELRGGGTLNGNSIYLNPNSTGNPTAGVLRNAVGSTLVDTGDSFLYAQNFGTADDGASALFDNRGTFRKNGSTGTTSINVNFTNSGTVDVQTGALQLSYNSTIGGTVTVANGATLVLTDATGSAVHNINNASAVSSSGTIQINAGTVNTTGTFTNGGLLALQGGVLNAGGAVNTASYTQSSGILSGSANLTVTGAASLTGGQMLGTGTTIVQGAATFGGSILGLDDGRTLELRGGGTLNGNSIYLNPNSTGNPTAGVLRNAVGSTLVDTGDSFLYAQNFGTADDGASALFDNRGTFRKNGSTGTTSINVNFTNSGTVDVQTGALQLSYNSTIGGTVTVANGATLVLTDATGSAVHNINNASAVSSSGTIQINAGTVNTTGTFTNGGLLALQGGVLNAGGAVNTASYTQSSGILSGSANLTVTGAASLTGGQMLGTGTTIVQGAATFGGSILGLDDGRTLELRGGGTLNGNSIYLNPNSTGNPTAGVLRNAVGSTLVDTGDSFLYAQNFGTADDGASALFDNRGTFRKNGSTGTTSINVNFTNSGTVDVQTGTLSFTQGTQGTGTLQISTNGTLTIGAPSTTGNLVHNGASANSLQLNGDIIVSKEYNNANFGIGNAFNARANVSGTGQILATTGTALNITGANITGGTAATPTMTIGNVHVGATTFNYQIANAGTGSSLGGAIQTGANGGLINDSRLSGAGVTASNFGPIAAGGNSGNLAVTFTVNGAGAYTTTSGQAVNVLSSFDNVSSQLLSINASGAAYNLAQGSAAPPSVSLGNAREGGGFSGVSALTISNTAPAGLFTEKLNASVGVASGNAFGTGSVSLLAAGSSNNTGIQVGLTNATAGGKSGTVTINFASDGSGTSGLGITGVGSQVVTVSGNVYRLAAASNATPNPVSFTNRHVGDVATQTLTIGNTAANDGFSEKLNASMSGATAGVTAAGSFTLLSAGATNNSSLSVGIDTSTAGHRAGSATINLASDGTGTSGFSALSIGTQTVNVSGDVYRLASASAHAPEPVNLGNVRVGGVATQTLTISNTAASDGFSEKLNASLGGASAGVTASGSFTLLGPQASDNASLVVGINTATAGAKAGTATITLVSDGAGTSGLGQTALGTQTVNISGNVFRLASASAHTPEPVSFGNVHVGDTVTQALTISNTAANDGFSEKLNANFSGSTGAATTSGAGVSLLAAGASNSTGLVVGLNTATAGAKTGTATIALQSDGTGTSGLSAIGIGSQVVNVSGAVYRLASANALAPVNFGVVHVGDTAQQALTISNTATNDGFSEKLNASFGSASDARITTSGSITQLSAGSSSTSMIVGLNTVAAGTVNGTVTVHFASDGTGTSNLGLTALASQDVGVSGDIQMTGSVFRLAQPSQHTPEPVNFGNVRVGTLTSQALSITNLAPNDGFSEKLNASIAPASGPVTATGSFTLLAPQATNNTSLVVGIDTATAGAKGGTATITLVSDGTGTSGLGQTPLGTQTVNISGNVFRLASASAHTPEPVTLGSVHVGGVATQALGITNTAANDGFSEKLNASMSGATAGVTAAGSFTLLNAQATNNSSLSVGIDTSSAGHKAGSATINLASDGTGTSGFSALSIGTQTVNVTGDVYNLAVANVTPNPVTLANQRVGGGLTQALTVANTAPVNPTFTETLSAGFASSTGNAIHNGGAVSGIAGGASNNSALQVRVDTSVAGLRTGTVTVNLTSNEVNGSGLGGTPLAPQQITVSGNVYQAASGLINTPALNFGTVQVGQSVSRVLSITNNASGAAGFVEDLNASFGTSSGTGAGLISGSGSINGLLAGATNNSNMTVGVNTSAAGIVNGAIAVNFVSAGAVNGVSNGLGTLNVGSTDYGVQGQIQANVINTASPVINNSPINLGNVRVGAASPSAFVSVTNQATTPPQAALNASISGNAPITASGSFNLLTPGATNNNTLQVGMNTANAGAINGTATIAFVSDASNVGGCSPNCQFNLASQDVNVSGAVYRLANPTLNTPPIALAARVGDAAPSAVISVTNTSPDIYTEGLKASIAAVPSGFTSSGSIANLAAQQTDAGSLHVVLTTGNAGTFSGSAVLGLASTGAGTTNAPDLALPDQAVGLTGKVYTPAQAQIGNTTINFGIVHKGDVVAAQALNVTNGAPVTALNDVLKGSFGGTSGPFSASGDLGAGLGASQTDNTSLTAGLSTANAGVFNGTAHASFASHNADMADLALPGTDITLLAQVNNFANPIFQLSSGDGAISGGGSMFILNFGDLRLGSGDVTAELDLLNDVLGPADSVHGQSFNTSGASDLLLSGFDQVPFDLDAGDMLEGLLIGLDTGSLGSISDRIVLSWYGFNPDFRGALGDITLLVTANVIEGGGSVPEPDSWALGLLALFALIGVTRRAATTRGILRV